ncbi:MAG: zinc-ribbon domain-containing protein [Acidobacteria bacterium]|nr:zinc-ribbon domain-containing protein [Acidobacteriota bacterium]
MPFCTKCGAEAGERDRFCRRCGTPQPGVAGGAGAPRASQAGDALSPRGASILCYVPWLGWLVSVWVLLNQRFRAHREVRFHAYQGLYLFVVWLLGRWVVDLWVKMLFRHNIPLSSLVEIALLALWIFMLVKTSSGERYSLPVIGELAERSL